MKTIAYIAATFALYAAVQVPTLFAEGSTKMKSTCGIGGTCSVEPKQAAPKEEMKTAKQVDEAKETMDHSKDKTETTPGKDAQKDTQDSSKAMGAVTGEEK